MHSIFTPLGLRSVAAIATKSWVTTPSLVVPLLRHLCKLPPPGNKSSSDYPIYSVLPCPVVPLLRTLTLKDKDLAFLLLLPCSTL